MCRRDPSAKDAVLPIRLVRDLPGTLGQAYLGHSTPKGLAAHAAGLGLYGQVLDDDDLGKLDQLRRELVLVVSPGVRHLRVQSPDLALSPPQEPAVIQTPVPLKCEPARGQSFGQPGWRPMVGF